LKKVLFELAQNFSLPVQNKIIYNFVIFVAAKKVEQQIVSPSFVAVVGPGMDKNQHLLIYL
jgi:hypothetical protein